MAEAPERAADAALIAALLALDPPGLGGVCLRGFPGPAREAWLSGFRALLPAETPVRRLPHGIADDRLLGGLDLAESLTAGRIVVQKGVLAEADGGFLVLAMAERLEPAVAARLVGAMDRGAVAMAREGVAIEHPARFGVVALDEGLEQDERPPAALADRLAFHIDLAALGRIAPHVSVSIKEIAGARAALRQVAVSSDLIEALCKAAAAFGIDSLRAVTFALNAARGIAALAGRAAVSEADGALAARLVFAPRATQLPAEAEEPSDDEPAPEDRADEARAVAPDPPDRADEDDAAPDAPLQDVVREAVRAALPADLLASLAAGLARGGGQGRSEAMRAKAAKRGRPIGSRRGDLRSGARLALLDTLRAAAPWQRLRQRHGGRRLEIRPSDIRVKRFKQRTRTTTIFVVDASGSAALHRLGEAKGAVETLLAECYVRRDEVALIAFRGKGAEVLLPPTRSLARTKRSLGRLPGGGGTPLAAGLRAAHELALKTEKRGDRPVLVFLTDGQANIAFDGSGGRARAQEDAGLAARALRAARFPALLIDTSPRPQAKAEALALAMGARYLPMPTADIGRLAGAVRQA